MKLRDTHNALAVSLFGKGWQFPNDIKPQPMFDGPSDLATTLCESIPAYQDRTPKTVATQISRYISNDYDETISSIALESIFEVLKNRIKERGGDEEGVKEVIADIAHSIDPTSKKLTNKIGRVTRKSQKRELVVAPHQAEILNEITQTTREILEQNGFKKAHLTHIGHQAKDVLDIVAQDPKIEKEETKELLLEEGFPQRAIKSLAHPDVRQAFYTFALINQ